MTFQPNGYARMNDTRPNSFVSLFARTVALFLVLLLSLAGCAHKKTAAPDPTAKGLSAMAAADYYYLLYLDLKRQGRAKDGVDVLEKLVALAPSPELYQDLANLYWGLAMPDKTRETLEAALKKYPEEKRLHFYLANSFLLQRRFDEAAKVLKDYLAKHPKDQATFQELGAVLVESGKFQEALDFLAQVPKERRTPAMSYYESKAYSGLGKRHKAIEKLRLALREDPNMLAGWSELAYIYEQENDFRQAEEAYLRIIDLGEEGTEVWLRLVRIALKQKALDKALSIISQAPKDRAFLFEAMGLFIEEGYQDASSKVLERLAQDQPGNPDVIFIQALMAIDQEKDLNKAILLLSQIPKDNPLYDKSLTTRLQLSLDNNQLGNVAPLVAEGKRLYPERIDFWFFEALLFERRQELPKSAEVLWKALQKWPDNTEAMYRYGVVLERMKNHTEAFALMEKILTIDPANPDALNFVGYSLADDGRDIERALDLINRALLVTPDNPYYLDSLAWAYFKKGDAQRAWTEIQRATAKNVEDPAIWEHYGDIAKAVGDKKSAAQGFAKALSLNPDNAAAIKAKLEGL